VSAFAFLFLITFPPSSSGQGDDAATAKALNQQDRGDVRAERAQRLFYG
jgi:hypothetical protein